MSTFVLKSKVRKHIHCDFPPEESYHYKSNFLSSSFLYLTQKHEPFRRSQSRGGNTAFGSAPTLTKGYGKVAMAERHVAGDALSAEMEEKHKLKSFT